MKASDFETIDLVSMDIAAELYGDTTDPEMVDMQKELWGGIRGDLLKELDEIIAASAGSIGEEVKRTMHRVAGYSGSGGLQRCCELLRALEHGKIPGEEVSTALQLARSAAVEGMGEIESRFPHLKEG